MQYNFNITLTPNESTDNYTILITEGNEQVFNDNFPMTQERFAQIFSFFGKHFFNIVQQDLEVE